MATVSIYVELSGVFLGLYDLKLVEGAGECAVPRGGPEWCLFDFPGTMRSCQGAGL